MPGIRRKQPGIDGTCYGNGWQLYTLGAKLKDIPCEKGSWGHSSWEAGWLDARDEYEAFYKNDKEAQDLARGT